jgi:hypothetical protein
MATLRAFFDDTGTHDGSKYMAIGGCVATAGAWDAFAHEWAEHLKSWDLEWFHMTDAESKREPPYRSWTDAHRDSRVGILARMVQRAIAVNIGVIVPAASYKEKVTNKLRGEAKRLGDIEGNPYYTAFPLIFRGIGLTCKAFNVEKSDVEIVFAEQAKLGPRVLEVWKQYIRDEGYQEPVFRPVQKLPPLQAADMVAWFVNRKFTRPNEPIRDRHSALKNRLLYAPFTEDHVARTSAMVDNIIAEADAEFGPKPERARRSRPRSL